MAGIWDHIGAGAAGGALAGAPMGPIGALVGALAGGAMGYANGNQPGVDDVIPKIDAGALTKQYMDRYYRPERRSAVFASQVESQKEKMIQALIGGGVDAAQARMIVERRLASAPRQFAETEADTQREMEASLHSQFLPAQLQRDEDRINYSLATKSRPSDTLAGFVPMIGATWMEQGRSENGGMGGIMKRWGIGGN